MGCGVGWWLCSDDWLDPVVGRGVGWCVLMFYYFGVLDLSCFRVFMIARFWSHFQDSYICFSYLVAVRVPFSVTLRPKDPGPK